MASILVNFAAKISLMQPIFSNSHRMPMPVTISVPRRHAKRVQTLLCQALGRDLTPEEQKYLGLTAPVVSISNVKSGQMARQRPQVKIARRA